VNEFYYKALCSGDCLAFFFLGDYYSADTTTTCYTVLNACLSVASVNGSGPHLNNMDALQGAIEYALSSVRLA
jgi:hypothetical protein